MSRIPGPFLFASRYPPRPMDMTSLSQVASLHRKRLAITLTVWAGLVSAPLHGQRVDEHLASLLATADSHARLSVYVVLADQLEPITLRARHAAKPPRERRVALAADLKAHAQSSGASVRALIAEAQSGGRAQLTDVLWMGNALLLEAEPAVVELLAAHPAVERVRASRALQPEQVQDLTPPPAGVGVYPFLDSFDSGVLAPHWTVGGTAQGRVTVTNAFLPLGAAHVVMDAAVNGVDSIAHMTVKLDLAGRTGVGLRFRHKEMTLNGTTGSDENHPEDGVFVSIDGQVFQQVMLLNNMPPQYQPLWVDLDAAFAGLALSYTNDVSIRFQWRDNFSAPDDGMAFDIIEIGPGVAGPPPAEPTPNLVTQQAPKLWSKGFDGSGVLIGSIDSGTWNTHADLASRIWQNPGELPGNGQDDDNNGYVDDVWGWDFENNDADPKSTDSHGTLSAGLMVGDGTSGTVTGMAPGATLVTCQVQTESQYWLAQQYLLDVGVDVISSSYSYKWPDRPDQHMFRQLCDLEWAAGIVHANSIGNQGQLQATHPVPMNVSTPGNVPSPFWHPDAVIGGRSSVLSCGGISIANDTHFAPGGRGPSAWEDLLMYDPAWPHPQLSAYWDYPRGGFGGNLPGLVKPDLVAYTLSVTSTTITPLPTDPKYALFSGTSAATPQLGGALGLLRQVQPAAEPRHLAAALQLTAKDYGVSGKDNLFGAGHLRAFSAAQRLVVLARAVPDVAPLGSTLNLELHGLPNQLIYGFVGVGLVTNLGPWNLDQPFFALPALPLDAEGRLTVPLAVPNDVFFEGLVVWFQFGQAAPVGVWETGKLLSVPEAVQIKS